MEKFVPEIIQKSKNLQNTHIFNSTFFFTWTEFTRASFNLYFAILAVVVLHAIAASKQRIANAVRRAIFAANCRKIFNNTNIQNKHSKTRLTLVVALSIKKKIRTTTTQIESSDAQQK